MLGLQRQLSNLPAPRGSGHVWAWHPDWTRAALPLARAERKKAGGRPLGTVPQAEHLRVVQRAEASVFAQILQEYEDWCLMAALRSLQSSGQRVAHRRSESYPG